MNLIPIDTGGTPTELVGGDASPGGDFAALMTGLMAGDTQIVPLIDIPTGEQLPEAADVAPTDQPADVATSVFEFIGAQPTGLTIPPSNQESPQTMPNGPDDGQAPVEGAPVPLTPVPGSLIANPEPDAPTETADGQALATVHPIRSHAATTPSTTPKTDITVSNPAAPGLIGNGPTGQQSDAAQPVSTEPHPEVAVAPPNRPATQARAEVQGALRLPTAEMPIAAMATATATATATGTQATNLTTPQASTLDQAGGDAQPVESDVDVDADIATASRPLDTVRSGSSITQPAMVGIARRVEEAIAALATKPDPKIVTLQLDELDGLRLTVALRPDGIHLSSSGDATLTTEIERALASRGFDMAAGSDRGRQGSGQNTDDGWRPQPSTTGRQPRTNQPGIRL